MPHRQLALAQALQSQGLPGLKVLSMNKVCKDNPRFGL